MTSLIENFVARSWNRVVRPAPARSSRLRLGFAPLWRLYGHSLSADPLPKPCGGFEGPALAEAPPRDTRIDAETLSDLAPVPMRHGDCARLMIDRFWDLEIAVCGGGQQLMRLVNPDAEVGACRQFCYRFGNRNQSFRRRPGGHNDTDPKTL